MNKKVFSIIVLFFILALAACASKPTVQANNGANPSGQPNGGNPQNSLESLLAAGTLKLEGTDQAVTADEAKQLLPLWQKVKSMLADSSTNPSDLNNVYQQIEQAMTASQIQAIQNMNLTQADLQNLMQNLGIQVTPGSFGNFPTLSADQLATRQAMGTPTPGGGSGSYATLSPEERSTRQAMRTLTPGANTGANTGYRGGFGRGFGFNQIFIYPLIQLLQTRAGG